MIFKLEMNRGVGQVDGMKITVEDIVGSTGLELKVDPGVPYVYAGFAGPPPPLAVLLAHLVHLCATL